MGAPSGQELKDAATLSCWRATTHQTSPWAMSTTDDAMRALSSNHSGLVLEAATQLKGQSALPSRAPQLTSTLLRLSQSRSATNRDPRMALLQRLLESADSASAVRLIPLLSDIDPDVAALAARVITERARVSSTARTTRYMPAPFTDDSAAID